MNTFEKPPASPQGGLIDEWPMISFAPIEDIEIDYAPARFFYHGFFKILHFPETILKSFYVVLTESE